MNQHRQPGPSRGGQHRQSRARSAGKLQRTWRFRSGSPEEEDDSPAEGTRTGKLPDSEEEQADEAPTKPKRQRVVLADRSPQPKTGLRPRAELAEQTSWGEMLIKDLIGAQLRLGLLVAGVAVLTFAGLPLAFALFPGFAELTVAGIPLAWVLLGIAPFPLLFGGGLLYNRIAQRQERAFVDMIES